MKTRKEILKQMIEDAKESEIRAQIIGKLYSKKVVAGNKSYELSLGQAQRQEKDAHETVRELEEQLKEL